MKNLLPFLAVIFSIYSVSCNTGTEATGTDVVQPVNAEGGRTYGGTLRVNETDPVQTLYPHAITDMVSNHVAAQIHETLLRIDTRDLTVIPGLASSWTWDSSGTVLTLKLRDNAYFHDDDSFAGKKGRVVTAADVKYTFDLLVTQSPENLVFPTTFQDRVVGANEYYQASAAGKPDFTFSGVKVLDNQTIQIELTAPNPSFLHILTQPSTAIMAPELVAQYGKDLTKGAGPYLFLPGTPLNEKIVLLKNPAYYGKDSLGNQLPFLDSVVFTFISEKRAELSAFMDDKIDLIIGLPAESIKDVLEKNIEAFENRPPLYVLDRSPELATQFYEFNTTSPAFRSKKVRQAFSYAIDRQRIVDEVLKGEAYGPGTHGLVPPSVANYDISKIKGYTFDPVKARKLLAEAGFSGGRNFPPVKLELNSGGSKNTNVALEIQRQLREVLGVNIDLEIVSFQTKLVDAQFGRADMFRSAWMADYPGPESFLQLGYGKNVPDGPNELSYPNVSRYKSKEFDKLFEAGLKARNNIDRYAFFALAEQLLMEDAPILVLWYDEKFRVYSGTLNNFFSNPLNFWDFREVYKKSPEGPRNTKS